MTVTTTQLGSVGKIEEGILGAATAVSRDRGKRVALWGKLVLANPSGTVSVSSSLCTTLQGKVSVDSTSDGLITLKFDRAVRQILFAGVHRESTGSTPIVACLKSTSAGNSDTPSVMELNVQLRLLALSADPALTYAVSKPADGDIIWFRIEVEL
jgi:hypothetical protein